MTRPPDPKPELAPTDPAHNRPARVDVPAWRRWPGVFIRWVPVLSFITLLVIVPAIVNSSSNSDAQRRSDAISACRSEANSLVVDATTNFHLVRNTRDNLNTDLNVLQNQQITAALGQDRVLYETIAAQLEPKREAIRLAQADVNEAVRKLDAVTQQYVEVAALSRDDPDRFLARCRSGEIPTTPPSSGPPTAHTSPTSTSSTSTTPASRSNTPRRTAAPSASSTTTSTTYSTRPSPSPPPRLVGLCELLPAPITLPPEVPCL